MALITGLQWLSDLNQAGIAHGQWDKGRTHQGETALPGQTTILANDTKFTEVDTGWEECDAPCETVKLGKYPIRFYPYGLGMEKGGCLALRSTVDVPMLSAASARKNAYSVTLGTDRRSVKLCAKAAPRHTDALLMWSGTPPK